MVKNENLNKKKLMTLQFTDSNKMYSYMLVAFLVLLILDLIAYFGFLNRIPDFANKFGFWIFYLNISIVTLGGSVWYYVTHKGYVSCMASMMIGMTIGMQTGMMIGAVFGAVNGYFVGAMVGMILGALTGALSGKDSIMGWLQGMMMGLMGGTMGAMITVMMFTDHVLWFMPFYTILNVLLLLGFNYMYYDEVVRDNKELIKNDIDIFTFISACVIVTTILTVLMIYAPKSVLFGG